MLCISILRAYCFVYFNTQGILYIVLLYCEVVTLYCHREGITESADGGLQASDDDMLYKIKKRK